MKCLLILILVWIPIARAELFSGANSPNNFNRIAGISLVTHFDSLPDSGKLIDDRLSWSETYWPSTVGFRFFPLTVLLPIRIANLNTQKEV